ncbi:TlpA family protein disulfide reductase [Leptothrix ochracea]|uniref:TlpA family protein disulfide reductase n=1 Tax=Leptothrix ochracea TaxID=735331 RepID=UPI0034E1F434
MKRLIALAFAAAAVATAPMSAMAAHAGEVAPEIHVDSAKGALNLASFKGKVVYLDFWASWCGPCKQSFPWMNEMQTKYGAKGLQVLAVNLDAKKADAEKFLTEMPAKFQVAFDPKGEAPRTYGIKGMPTAVLIGADGKVIEQHGGFREEDRAHLEEQIVKALAAASAK